MTRILVTGAAGQLGTELVPELRRRYGADRVVTSDISPSVSDSTQGPSLLLDVTDARRLERTVAAERIDAIFHLAAILSARGEARPQRTWAVNSGGLLSVLEAAREHGCAVFTPSSIAAFGPGTPPDPAPQDTLQRPSTMYGVTKVAGELLCDYYHARFGVDARGVRYPGLISHSAPPGGGTTDYAVEIFREAAEHGRYSCFLAPDTRLDMLYMPDAIRAAIELMEADPDRLEHRNAFNVTAMQVTPEDIAAAIRRRMPDFRMEYDVDPRRQAIAESWPRRIDDSAARREWGWRPAWDLESMTEDMLNHLSGDRGTTGA
ncbi:MAG: NAD-dependent epimerase/dehydratase family protein [Gemmatimonadota bacterium]